MDKLFERHDEYISGTPMDFFRRFSEQIDGGLKIGDFRIDGEVVVEVGGRDKGFSQVKNETRAYVAAYDMDSATSLSSTSGKIPLWAFGFLY